MTTASTWTRRPLSKGAAFAVHLALSLLIFSSLVLMMLLFWFPGDLFFMDGGWQGLKLVAMVDLVLGPALTLILYKPGKPKLIMDMSLIAFIQIAALGYGFYTTYQQRTVAVVFATPEFNTVSASDKLEADIQLRELSLDPQSIPRASLMSIPLLITPLPADGGYGRMLQDIFNGFPAPAMRSDQYAAITDNHEEMRKNVLTEQQLSELGALDAVQETLEKRSLAFAEVEVYKFIARYADGMAIFDPQDKRIIDYVAIDKTAAEVNETNTVDVADGDTD